MEMRNLIGVATVLAVSFILVATFFLVSEQLKGIHADSDYKASTSFTDTVLSDETNQSLAPRLLPYGGDNNSLEFFCADATTGIQIPTGNLTFFNTNSPETLALVQNAAHNTNVTANCTYNSTDFGTKTWQSMNNSEISIGSYADWGDMLVVAAMASLILSLVLVAIVMGFSRKGVM